MAATIAIVDFNGNKVKEWTIYHKPHSFLVNSFTKEVNGFKSDSFVKGQPYEVVQKELVEFMDSKLWIMVDASNDFDSIGLTPRDHDFFDLQMEYWSYVTDEQGNEHWAGHALQSIYMHFFKESLQIGIHTAAEDAKGTMRIFREVYIHNKLNNVMSKFNLEPYDNIVRIKSRAKMMKEKFKLNKRN
jgi:hypothetical protein